MCGIAGYMSKNKAINGAEYYWAHNTMAHRGPDDEGFLTLDKKLKVYAGRRSVGQYRRLPDICAVEKINAVISHVRLSILDLSDAGHQPFVDYDEQVAVVFNGEIYNYKELREELKKKGYIFKSNCDTEVVLNSYLCWGKSCFNKFNGMWAIAIVDKINRKLILSRDRFGIKPLFYYEQDGQLIFSSEIKVIKALKNSLHINTKSVERYLKYNYICDGMATIFSEIKEVEPASWLEYDDSGRCNKERYWMYRPKSVHKSENEVLEEFSTLFESSVKLRMRSDVCVGSLLSGGLDSNTIVGALGKNGLLDSTYRAFSSVYDEIKYSEKEYIELTQKKWNINVEYLNMTAEDIAKDIDSVLYYSEMPLRSASVVLQYKLYEEIRNNSNTRVVLNGQGADELFGGYTNNYYTRFTELLCNLKLKQLKKEWKQFRYSRNANGRDLLYALIGHKNSVRFLDKDLFNKFTFNQITSTPLREYLMYDDRQSMAFGIEARAPFLDYRLVEFAFSLESSYKVNEIYNKDIVRRYAKNIVADDIINRKDKMGFTSPQEEWQRSQWRTLFDEEFKHIKMNGLLDLNTDKFYSDYVSYKDGKNDDWAYIWRVYCLSRWERSFVHAK